MLSSESVAVLFFGIHYLEVRENWLDKAEDLLDEVTDADWDEIEHLVGNVAYELMNSVIETFPESFYSDALALTVVTGTALSRTVNATALVNHFVQITPLAQFNAFGLRTFLREGAYTLSVLGSTANNRGITTVGCSAGVVTGTMDWYSSASVANVVKTVTVQITSAGVVEFSFHADSKNASSSNYDQAFQAVWAERTGD
jgi:hypothetical protein